MSKELKRHICIGLTAHVDAGKTTLAEAMMFETGKIRKLGRVDHGDTVMDTNTIERERGITIFSSQAEISTGNLDITLLDTPGHIDFSAETERTLQILDYVIMVISGIDGVQSHTHTIWRLLSLYNIPTFVFITKMDFARKTREELLGELKSEFGEGFFDLSEINSDAVQEEISFSREDVLEHYMEYGSVTDGQVSELIASRLIFPCCFGSGLKLTGVPQFISALERYTITKEYPDEFGAKVYKISHDAQENRLTHLKVTGGKLRVKDSIFTGEQEEKVNQIRIYSGAKFVTAEEVPAGAVCAVSGLNGSLNGQGLGIEAASSGPVLEPVMSYRVVPPKSCDSRTLLNKLKLLEEEDPQLHVTWKEHLQEINVGLMGEVQTEILKRLIAERFNIDVTIDSGRVLYKETIANTVEGVGHYEPLKHYAEVHLIMEPLKKGEGVVITSKCSEDVLDRNWQRLIMTHLMEKQHLGVLTGSPITDIKITLAAGRAHLKHTEGGDFRQATYRAVRQGLMQAKTVLLEPYYAFKIEVPREQIGRVINDIRLKGGTFSSPEDSGNMSVLCGRAPVVELNSYAAEISSYTGGRGRISLSLDGYDICHNQEKVVEDFAYDPESDLANTPDSVFCAHGAGFTVKWDKVSEYMHLESCLMPDKSEYTVKINRGNIHIDDKELEAIMDRGFGPIKRPMYRAPIVNSSDKKQDINGNLNRIKWYIIDGYNLIFASERLSALAENDLDAARSALITDLSNYHALTKHNIVVVFDAYKVEGGLGKRYDTGGIHVAFTKENETADMYIEKLVADIGKNEQVSVVTSDNLIRLSAIRSGVLRISSVDFVREVERVKSNMRSTINELKKKQKNSIGDNVVLRDDLNGS